jgi:hypothetical protein
MIYNNQIIKSIFILKIMEKPGSNSESTVAKSTSQTTGSNSEFTVVKSTSQTKTRKKSVSSKKT